MWWLVHRQYLVADTPDLRRAAHSILPTGPIGTLIDLSQLALLEVQDGVLVDLNGAAEILLGAPVHACRGRALHAFWPNVPSWMQFPAEVGEHGNDAGPRPVDCVIRRSDGQAVHVVGHALFVPATDRLRRAALFNVSTSRTEVAPPSTERPYRVFLALARAQDRHGDDPSSARLQASLQHVIDAAPLAMAVFDRGGRLLRQANQAADLFFGRPCRELIASAPTAWSGVDDEEFRALLQSCLDLAAEFPSGVRRDFVRPAGDDGIARVWDTRVVAISSGENLEGVEGEAGDLLMVANEVTDLRAAEQERFDAAIAQRGMLVQEVHHRIKNNLQGVAGLLQQASSRFPQVAPILTEAVGQLQAIAQVYGLQVGASGPVPLAGLLEAVAMAVQRTFSRSIEVLVEPSIVLSWRLPEAEAIPVALTANELLTNAVKHGADGAIRLRMFEDDGGVVVEILNAGHLRPGFDIRAVPAGASGLGLVRALLPRRNAELALFQQGEQVCTRVRLRPPAVRRDG